jgi:hypothetical protein
MATRDELVQGVEFLIRESRRLANDLSEEQWENVVDLDGWKNREVLAHIAGVGGMVVPMTGGLLNAPAGTDALGAVDINALNAGIVAQRAGKSATELADEVEKSYRGVIDWLKGADAAMLEKRVTAGGHKDVPAGDVLMRMVVLHGLGHVYSVYSSIFFAAAQ